MAHTMTFCTMISINIFRVKSIKLFSFFVLHARIYAFFIPYEWGLREASVLGQTSVWAKLRSWALPRSWAQLQSGPNFGLFKLWYGPNFGPGPNFGLGLTSVYSIKRYILKS